MPGDSAAFTLAQESASPRVESLARRVAELETLLAERDRETQHLSEELALTEQRERGRLAGELHDYLAQLLTSCRLALNTVRYKCEDTLSAQLLQAERSVDEAILYTRTMMSLLHPTMLREKGLCTTLHWLADRMRRHGLELAITAPDAPAITGSPALLCLDVVRELLFNVLKHAGTNAAQLDVAIGRDCLTVSVVDEGKGFDAGQAAEYAENGTHYGLPSVRDRVRQAGGTLDIASAPGKGTRVTLVLPLCYDGFD